MNFVNLQPSYTRVRPKVGNAPAPKPIREPKRTAKRPKLYGRVSEVTVVAGLLTMLAPLGLVAFAAGMPGVCLAAGLAAGCFGASVFLAERLAVSRG